MGARSLSVKELELERDGEESLSRLHTVRGNVSIIALVLLHQKTYDIDIGPSICDG